MQLPPALQFVALVLAIQSTVCFSYIKTRPIVGFPTVSKSSSQCCCSTLFKQHDDEKIFQIVNNNNRRVNNNNKYIHHIQIAGTTSTTGQEHNYDDGTQMFPSTSTPHKEISRFDVQQVEWSIPKVFQKSIVSYSIVSTLMFCTIFGSLLPLPATASSSASPPSSSSLLLLLSSSSIDPFVYTNDYDDPFHPLCKRHIEVSSNGKTFQYTGTAVGPKGDPVLRGCSKDEIRKYKLRKGSFDGYILEDGRISAGDGIHEGFWEPAAKLISNNNKDNDIVVTEQEESISTLYTNVDGIRWNDGNKWIVHTKPLKVRIGEIIFYSYIGFSTLAGVKGLYDGIMRKKQEADEQYV